METACGKRFPHAKGAVMNRKKAAAAVIAIAAIIISIYCKVKYGTFLIWKAVAKKRAADAA